jgi:hypothetical protein
MQRQLINLNYVKKKPNGSLVWDNDIYGWDIYYEYEDGNKYKLDMNDMMIYSIKDGNKLGHWNEYIVENNIDYRKMVPYKIDKKDGNDIINTIIIDETSEISAEDALKEPVPVITTGDKFNEPVISAEDTLKEPVISIDNMSNEPVISAEDTLKEPAISTDNMSKEPVISTQDILKESAISTEDMSKEPVISTDRMLDKPVIYEKDIETIKLSKDKKPDIDEELLSDIGFSIVNHNNKYFYLNKNNNKLISVDNINYIKNITGFDMDIDVLNDINIPLIASLIKYENF